MCTLYNYIFLLLFLYVHVSCYRAVPLMINTIYGNLQQTHCWLHVKCSWLVLKYITNPSLLLCGFAQYETERLQYFMQFLRSDVANTIEKEYIYKDILPVDFATQALALFIKITCILVKLHTYRHLDRQLDR
jgi:hypothetical protein